jgi:hypothetical protein
MVAALAAAPSALAGGPTPYALQNGPGIVGSGGALRYVALAGDRNSTTVEAIATRGGAVHAFAQLLGAYGLPYSVLPNYAEGLSADGRTLVLGDASDNSPHTRSSFAILATPTLRIRNVFFLKGDFAYDAISPDGSRLYLIQHTDVNQTLHYVVREYDVRAHRLLARRVADRTQRGWVMTGYPVARTTTPDHRWVYTLYDNPNGFPFVHALDTVRGVAHCVGLPLRRPNAASDLSLTLRGDALRVHWRSGRSWLVVDTRTWRLSPDRGGRGVPWWAWTALAALAATIVVAYGRRTGALATGTARRDRGSARLGPWLPLTRQR